MSRETVAKPNQLLPKPNQVLNKVFSSRGEHSQQRLSTQLHVRNQLRNLLSVHAKRTSDPAFFFLPRGARFSEQIGKGAPAGKTLVN